MDRLILGLLGVKGCGKDTAAQYLAQAGAGSLAHGIAEPFVRIGFADALYLEVARAYGVSGEFLGNRDTKETALPELALANCADRAFVHVLAALENVELEPCEGPQSDTVLAFLHKPRSPRFTLQLWGTEYRRRTRHGRDGYWLEQVAEALRAQPERHFVITDVRFENEARFIEQAGGLLVRIRRPALEAREALERARRGTAAHPSETELLERKVHAEIVNEEGAPDSLRQGLAALLGELGRRSLQRAPDFALR